MFNFNLVKKTFGEKSARNRTGGKKKRCTFRKEGSSPMPNLLNLPNLPNLPIIWQTWKHLARDTVEKGLRLVIARQRLQRITLTASTACELWLSPLQTTFSHLCHWSNLATLSGRSAFFTFLGYSSFVKPKQLGPRTRTMIQGTGIPRLACEMQNFCELRTWSWQQWHRTPAHTPSWPGVHSKLNLMVKKMSNIKKSNLFCFHKC